MSGLRRPKTSPAPRPPAFNTHSSPKAAVNRDREDVDDNNDNDNDADANDNDDHARRDSPFASSHSASSSLPRPATATTAAPTTAAPTTTARSLVSSVRARSSLLQLRKTPSLPAIVVHDAHRDHPPTDSDARLRSDDAFRGIDTIIPTGAFDDLTSLSYASFSKRGSMLLAGKRANRASTHLRQLAEVANAGKDTEQLEPSPGGSHVDSPTRPHSNSSSGGDQHTQLPALVPVARSLSPRSPSRLSNRGRCSTRILSADEMMLSRKVRAMYRHGNESAADWDQTDTEAGSLRNPPFATPINGSNVTVDRSPADTPSLRSSKRDSIIPKEATEIAGGLEDWADVEGGEVDRYGFIIVNSAGSQTSSGGGAGDGPDEPRMHRVSTALQLAASEPRRHGIGRSASRVRSIRSAKQSSASPRRRVSQRSSKVQESIFSGGTARSTPSRPLRQAANRLPHNKDRRLMDEASDMLKLPPGLSDLAEQREGGRAVKAMKAKEIEREDKWRKMARVVETGAKGGGMMFEFDTKDPKLVSRTWKGIPDRWRATAWYAFLAASAKADKESPSDEELIESFYELQEQSSADDMQIDVDVPRTINRHIMFRRRYRGGQRLLFRVLHAMSLYLPDTGYVQGMAALAATLLCYYEEDKAFVMLVRLWLLRGLERLYESGFTGLMEALQEFETNWLRGGEVATKLEELGITSTAYGTRWYLTLFNYSLPFPAQLRVWDVFMLLGDVSHAKGSPGTFSGDLDVLHATSAALIDATKEILLDSDFENAMKVLTSWIPIKDEDLLMKVAKAEYKMRKKRAHS